MTTLLWLLYFLVPTEGGFFDGLPLSPVDTIGVVLVLWIAAHRVRIPAAWVAGGAAVALAIATAAVPGDAGMHARYFATADATASHERSVEFSDPEFTRVDRRLDFSRGRHDLPLVFFNDHTRFNFMRLGEPDRRYLGFAAAWSGWWWGPGGTRTIFLHAPGATAEIAVDASTILRVGPTTGDQQVELPLSAGWHRLHVALSSPYGGSRDFAAGTIDGGTRVPFDASTVRTERPDSRQTLVARILSVVKPAVDVVAVGWLALIGVMLLIRHAGAAWQRRGDTALIALFIAGAIVEALRFAWPWAARLRIMAPGDDPMVYEGYARDILFKGILMNGGGAPGQGEPFYFQAFYPYFLAATHAIFGESFFGALFVQRLLVGITAVAITRIAMTVGGARVWPTLAVAAAFVYWKLAPISADMLSESLYVPLLAAWAYFSVKLCVKPTTPYALVAALTGGFTAITRSTAILAWPFVWAAAFVSLRGNPRRVRLIAVFAGVSLAVFSLITIRNAIVSYRFAPMPTELGITLRAGNEPPGDLAFNPAPRKWLYDLIRADGHTAEVMEYAFTRPGAFAANMGRKVLFVLGFYEAWVPDWGYSPVYIATWISAIAGVLLLRRRSDPLAANMVPLMIALTQFVAIVIVYPKGERLIVPIHTMLLPYSAIAADQLWRWITAPAAASATPARTAH